VTSQKQIFFYKGLLDRIDNFDNFTSGSCPISAPVKCSWVKGMNIFDQGLGDFLALVFMPELLDGYLWKNCLMKLI